MKLEIPDQLISATRMSSTEVLQELAVLLFQRYKLTLGQASQLAGITQFQFQHLLSSRGIPVHYEVADFEADLRTLDEMGRP